MWGTQGSAYETSIIIIIIIKALSPLKLMFFYGGDRLNILKIPPKMLQRKHQISLFVCKIFWGRTPRPPLNTPRLSALPNFSNYPKPPQK